MQIYLVSKRKIMYAEWNFCSKYFSRTHFWKKHTHKDKKIRINKENIFMLMANVKAQLEMQFLMSLRLFTVKLLVNNALFPSTSKN